MKRRRRFEKIVMGIIKQKIRNIGAKPRNDSHKHRKGNKITFL